MAIIRSQCGGCSIGCGVRALTGEGRSILVEGDRTHPINLGALCDGAQRLSDQASLDGRLLFPMIEGKRQKWDRAIAHVSQRLSAILARFGPGSVALHVGEGLTIEDLYVANKMMKGFLGSAHVETAATEAAAMQCAAYGEDVTPATCEDLDASDLILIVGSLVARRHPVLMERVQAAREDRGALVVAIIDDGSEAPCDIRLDVTPGSIPTLIAGLLLHCHHVGAAPGAVVEGAAGFWEQLREGHDLWSVARTCRVTPADLRAFYDLWMGRPLASTLYDEADRAAPGIINLHLTTGRIGRRGAAPFGCAAGPGVLASREVGALPGQIAAHRPFSGRALAEVARFWGARAMAEREGLSGAALLAALRDGRVKALWSIGEEPADDPWLAAARDAAAFSVRSTASLDAIEGQGWSVLLPSPVWAERDGTVTSTDRLISRHRRLMDLPGEAKPDWWAFTRIAQAMGWGDAFHYERPADIYREHARLTAYCNDGERLLNLRRRAPISNPAYDELTPWRWGGAPFADGRFPTPGGRARLLPMADQRGPATS